MCEEHFPVLFQFTGHDSGLFWELLKLFLSTLISVNRDECTQRNRAF